MNETNETIKSGHSDAKQNKSSSVNPRPGPRYIHTNAPSPLLVRRPLSLPFPLSLSLESECVRLLPPAAVGAEPLTGW